jgi:hypothetical protein
MINIAVADVITINQTSAAVAADTTSVLDFNCDASGHLSNFVISVTFKFKILNERTLLQSTIASGFVSGILFKSSCKSW